MTSTSETDTGTWAELFAPGMGAATMTVSLGVVLFAFNAFVVATALPAAVAEFGGGAWIAWATALYLIFAIVTGSAAAAVMHRLGARRLFVGAGLIFLAGTLLASFAGGMGQLLAGRALQGAGAGFIESGCYVLIPQLFPRRLISKVFGVEAVAWAIAAFGGPALAGVLTSTVSWRAALFVSAPLAVLFLILVPRVVRGAPEPNAEARPGQGLPILPLAGIAGGMGLILVSGSGGSFGWQSGLLAAGFAMFALTVWADGRAKVRLLPPRAFGLDHVAGLGLWIVLLMPIAQSAQAVFANYVLQFLWGFTPLASGLATSVLAFGWSGMQALAAHRPWSRMRLVVAGAALLVVGMGMLVWAFSGGGVAVMLAAMAAIGIAFGASWGALSQVVMQEAVPADRDVTSGLLPTVMAAGYGLGAALWGLVANGMGFAGARGEALQQVIVRLFAMATLPAVAALVLALLMARQLTVARSGNSR